MLYIDANKMIIELTRSDSASIVFSAVDGEGTTYEPTEGDVLTFAVSKKLGADPLFSVSNTYDGTDTETFWTVEIQPEHTSEQKFGDYVWDLQLKTTTGTMTIIGKTDNLSPKFRVWGEVAK